MKREVYCKPQTLRGFVELEQGVCVVGSPVYTKTTNEIKASKHDTGFDSKDGDDGFQATEWQ